MRLSIKYRDILISISILVLLTMPLATMATTSKIDPNRSGIESFLVDTANTAGYDASSNGNKFTEVAATVARVFIGLVGIIFMAYIIYGGYLWMTAAGNDEKISKAKKIIRDGIIGMVVIFSAAAIYLLIRNSLIGSDSDSSLFAG